MNRKAFLSSYLPCFESLASTGIFHVSSADLHYFFIVILNIIKSISMFNWRTVYVEDEISHTFIFFSFFVMKIYLEIPFSDPEMFFVLRDHVEEHSPNEILRFSFSKILFPKSIIMCKAEKLFLNRFWWCSFSFGNRKC